MGLPALTLPEIRQVYPNHSTAWSKAELRRLVKWHRKGAKPTTIAAHLGRTPNSVLCQLVRLGKLLEVFGCLDGDVVMYTFYDFTGRKVARWQHVDELRAYVRTRLEINSLQ